MPDGRWQTIVPDAGAFGGMARTMTVDLTGLLAGPDCRLRLTSNLEIYYDQVFLARDAGRDKVQDPCSVPSAGGRVAPRRFRAGVFSGWPAAADLRL